MDPPGITRHRRPFLAPVWLGLLATLAIAGVGLTLYRSATTTVVLLVRPVEKQPGSIDDPPLSPEGEQRAQRLAQMFGDGGGRLDAIYASDDRRAQQTAAPLAERLRRAPVVFAAAESGATAAHALREHAGGAVLVIVSGSGLTQMLRELDPADATAAAEGESDLMYIVSVPSYGRPHLVRFRL